MHAFPGGGGGGASSSRSRAASGPAAAALGSVSSRPLLSPLFTFSSATPGMHTHQMYPGLASCLEWMEETNIIERVAKAAHYARIGQGGARDTTRHDTDVSSSRQLHLVNKFDALHLHHARLSPFASEDYSSSLSLLSTLCEWLDEAFDYRTRAAAHAHHAQTTGAAAMPMTRATSDDLHPYVRVYTLAELLELRSIMRENLSCVRELESESLYAQPVPTHCIGYRSRDTGASFPFTRGAVEREWYQKAMRVEYPHKLWRLFERLHHRRQTNADEAGGLGQDRGTTPEQVSEAAGWENTPVDQIRGILQSWCAKGSATTSDGRHFRPTQMTDAVQRVAPQREAVQRQGAQTQASHTHRFESRPPPIDFMPLQPHPATQVHSATMHHASDELSYVEQHLRAQMSHYERQQLLLHPPAASTSAAASSWPHPFAATSSHDTPLMQQTAYGGRRPLVPQQTLQSVTMGGQIRADQPIQPIVLRTDASVSSSHLIPGGAIPLLTAGTKNDRLANAQGATSTVRSLDRFPGWPDPSRAPPGRQVISIESPQTAPPVDPSAHDAIGSTDTESPLSPSVELSPVRTPSEVLSDEAPRRHATPPPAPNLLDAPHTEESDPPYDDSRQFAAVHTFDDWQPNTPETPLIPLPCPPPALRIHGDTNTDRPHAATNSERVQSNDGESASSPSTLDSPIIRHSRRHRRRRRGGIEDDPPSADEEEAADDASTEVIQAPARRRCKRTRGKEAEEDPEAVEVDRHGDAHAKRTHVDRIRTELHRHRKRDRPTAPQSGRNSKKRPSSSLSPLLESPVVVVSDSESGDSDDVMEVESPDLRAAADDSDDRQVESSDTLRITIQTKVNPHAPKQPTKVLPMQNSAAGRKEARGRDPPVGPASTHSHPASVPLAHPPLLPPTHAPPSATTAPRDAASLAGVKFSTRQEALDAKARLDAHEVRARREKEIASSKATHAGRNDKPGASRLTASNVARAAAQKDTPTVGVTATSAAVPLASLSSSTSRASSVAAPPPSPAESPSHDLVLQEESVVDLSTGRTAIVYVYVHTRRSWHRDADHKRLASRDETVTMHSAERLRDSESDDKREKEGKTTSAKRRRAPVITTRVTAKTTEEAQPSVR